MHNSALHPHPGYVLCIPLMSNCIMLEVLCFVGVAHLFPLAVNPCCKRNAGKQYQQGAEVCSQSSRLVDFQSQVGFTNKFGPMGTLLKLENNQLGLKDTPAENEVRYVFPRLHQHIVLGPNSLVVARQVGTQYLSQFLNPSLCPSLHHHHIFRPPLWAMTQGGPMTLRWSRSSGLTSGWRVDTAFHSTLYSLYIMFWVSNQWLSRLELIQARDDDEIHIQVVFW